ncbi:MAG TPA: TolC family protein [Gemmataceae bacterium]|nr:TolC family protein [Gemmataceae bacterium]
MPSRRRVEERSPRMSRFVASVLGAAAVVGLGGCTLLSEYLDNGFKVGPNYVRPPVPLSPKWIDEGDPRVAVGCPNLAEWWDVFGDPILADLVRRAYGDNRTLRAAAFHIMATAEQRRIAASELLPQSQTASFSYTHSQVSATGGAATGPSGFFGTGLAPPGSPPPVSVPSTPVAGQTDPGPGTTTTNVTTGGITNANGTPVGSGVGRYFNNWATGLNLSWELDFWGLFRRNLEAANATLDQSVFNRDETAVLVLADVATQYVEIRTLQRRLQLARRNVRQQEPLVALYERRYKQGIANSLPGYAQLRSNLENTRALIPQLEILLREFNNGLCSLLGIPAQDLTAILGDGTIPGPARPEDRAVRIPRPLDEAVVVGIPGEILLQRPDVKAAEQQLRIQAAEIGIAEAEMFPHIGINGSIGLASNQFGRLFEHRSGTGSIGPSLTWNILNYGRLLANIRLQNDVYQQQVNEYQQAILNANQDAENALNAYLRSIEQAEHLRLSAESAATLTDYLLRQFQTGYLPPGGADTGAFINQLFTALNFQVTQQDAAAQAEGNVALNLILLYRALGGGWQLRLGADGRGANGCVLAEPAPPTANLPPANPVPQPPAPTNPPDLLPPPKGVEVPRPPDR